MFPVIRRSLVRAALRTELWAGNRERWVHMLHPSHPIRWPWNTRDRRPQRRRGAYRAARVRYLAVLRLRQPRQTEQLLRDLKQTNGPSALTGFRAAS
jgi:hypothetical protein